MDKWYLTNLKDAPFQVYLRVWTPKDKGNVRSRLECPKVFSYPFKGATKHSDIRDLANVDRIKILGEVTDSVTINRLSNW